MKADSIYSSDIFIKGSFSMRQPTIREMKVLKAFTYGYSEYGVSGLGPQTKAEFLQEGWIEYVPSSDKRHQKIQLTKAGLEASKMPPFVKTKKKPRKPLATIKPRLSPPPRFPTSNR
jgi:hypothetical protein